MNLTVEQMAACFKSGRQDMHDDFVRPECKVGAQIWKMSGGDLNKLACYRPVVDLLKTKEYPALIMATKHYIVFFPGAGDLHRAFACPARDRIAAGFCKSGTGRYPCRLPKVTR